MYCTKQKLIERFGEHELIQLTDHDMTAGAIVDAVLNRAIDDATAEINGYLTAYTLPLATVPANFELIACNIVRYHLYKDAATDLVKERYKQAIKYLESVSSGGINLAPDTSGTVVQTEGDYVTFSSSPSVFSR
jgi:phage gp36-like protein